MPSDRHRGKQKLGLTRLLLATKLLISGKHFWADFLVFEMRKTPCIRR